MNRLLAALVVLLLTGCGTGTATDDGSPRSDVPHRGPPPLVLLLPAGDAALAPGSSCWENMCVDMAAQPVSDLDDIGSPDSVDVGFDVDGAALHASFTLAHGCSRDYSVEATENADGSFHLEPAGPAGRYRVDLWAEVSQGDAAGSFVWTTTDTGALPTPRSALGIVWQPHDKIEGSGFLMSVEDLAQTPGSATATVTATAGNGTSRTFNAGKANLSCPAEGALWFSERGEALSQEIAALGPAPFVYDVDLVLDGQHYAGTGTWPDDAIENTGGSVTLTFTPPLPAYTG